MGTYTLTGWAQHITGRNQSVVCSIYCVHTSPVHKWKGAATCQVADKSCGCLICFHYTSGSWFWHTVWQHPFSSITVNAQNHKKGWGLAGDNPTSWLKDEHSVHNHHPAALQRIFNSVRMCTSCCHRQTGQTYMSLFPYRTCAQGAARIFFFFFSPAHELQTMENASLIHAVWCNMLHNGQHQSH